MTTRARVAVWLGSAPPLRSIRWLDGALHAAAKFPDAIAVAAGDPTWLDLAADRASREGIASAGITTDLMLDYLGWSQVMAAAAKHLGATTILVETAGDMTAFATAAHLCSWGGMCPGQEESAGKRRSGRTRKGNPFLRAGLIEAGLAASRAKGTALQARYYRVKRHRGHKKAVVATAHHILEIAFYIMRDNVTYQELGADYFDRRDRERTIRRHVRHLESLGYRVTIEEVAA